MERSEMKNLTVTRKDQLLQHRESIEALFFSSFGQRALDLWLTPAFDGAERALALVGASILPTAAQWLK